MARDNRALYELTVNGQKRTLLLDQEDADRYGDAARKVAPKGRAAANKAIAAENK